MTIVRDAPLRREPVSQHSWWAPVALSPGLVLGGLGAVGVVLSLFFPWRDPSVHADAIPVAFLWDKTTRAADPSLLVVLIPIAVVLIVGALSPLGAGLRFLGGVAVLAVAGVFAYQLSEIVSFAQNGSDVGDVLSTGFYLAAVGGLFALASAFARTAWFGRRAGGIVEEP
ncbi:MAG TPA: hypothetical protein VGU73_05345 [Acidimicrobiia bacterium]|nr:hypothetical protein [Acidimicrobiia bacterium]